MKTFAYIITIAAFGCAISLPAQPRARSSSAPSLSSATTAGDYASDLGVVLDAERQALDQARALLEDDVKGPAQAALQTAIKEMERSQAALEAAKKSPDKLPAALAAEQSAYQALLKAVPREFRMSRSRSRSQGAGSSSGQPNQQEIDQLDLTKDENRYETESQAKAAPTAEQREQSETLDRLKQLARRQQDLNDRLRDLQTALQEAKTDQEREDIQRQLKRLRDEERQMLADVDELRQKMEQSPNASRQSESRQQLEQTRTDVQKAAQELERQSVSEALAAGARAEQNLQKLRENMRQQTSSQFANQMRQMRSQAHEMSRQEDDIAKQLDTMNNTGAKSLDDASQRQQLVQQMNRQQSALTNLLGEMRAVTEQAESTEPLLSKQLYDILRRADQMHTENQLDMGAQLVDRGFLPQASEAEGAARTNINELRQSVDRAAESVLGNEADALKYAQKELDDLSPRRSQANWATEPNGSLAANAAPMPDGTRQRRTEFGGTKSMAANTNSIAASGNEPGGQ